MSNMSYCRFENTDNDLADCQNALEELINGDHGKLSQSEVDAAKRLVDRCMCIVQLVADARCIDLESDGGLDKFENDYQQLIDDVNEQASD